MSVRDQLIAEVIQDGTLRNCPVCCKKMDATMPMRILCTAMVVSRGPQTDPKVLRNNYFRGSVVCSDACKCSAISTSQIHGTSEGHKTPEDGSIVIDMEDAIRIAAEDRSESESCNIVMFPPMEMSAFIANVIVTEVIARVDILIAQTRTRGSTRISDTLKALSRAIKLVFLDNDAKCNEFTFVNPFNKDTDDARTFDKTVGLFAVHACTLDTANAQRVETIFEKTIVQHISSSLHKRAVILQNMQADYSDVDHPYILFPIQICHDDNNKMNLRIALSSGAHYVFM